MAHIDTFPIAVEMILPYLLNEAADAGLQIDRSPYARLSMLREKKLHYIRQNPLKAGEAPTYSWEALGLNATESLLDGSGGVGHSPAATAAWLRSASQKSNLRKYIPIAERYLECAKRATGVEVPGVVPNVFPITGFEFSYGLYALQVAGILDHPLLKDNVEYMANELHQILQKAGGVSFGDFFIPDVDDTSVSVIALRHLGYNVNSDYIWNFRHHDHFYTFKAEFNPSVFSNAHALQALYLCDEYNHTTEKFLIDCQSSDGYWHPDKWHSSWRYTTLEVIQPLLSLGHNSNLQAAIAAIIKDQNHDGGWGMGDSTSSLETAYCMLALSKLHSSGYLNEDAVTTLRRGQQCLLEVYNKGRSDRDMHWLGKELYSPCRVNRIYELAALYTIQMVEAQLV